MKELKNVEVVTEENTEVVAIPEEKEGFMKKVGNTIKTKGPKVLKALGLVAVGLVGGYLLSNRAASHDQDCDCEDCEVIDADDYTVEDAE